ncbi:putative NBS resistance protein [Trifolium pratense]|uniref:Putative NBS resistance protein n=2 Tax=Trifolium pratense TaxID=57577 RepID=A0A2K3LMX5_TRIPR|nr:putative NBS resistance protein [Trifolium pratense]
MAGSTPPPSICPWRFLETIDSPPKSVPESPSQPSYQKKSFAQALSNSVVVPENPFPKTSIKGDAVSIKITEKEYQLGIDEFKNNLHGRLILPKGSKPCSTEALRTTLAKLWKPLGAWNLTPLGRGYFNLSFASQDDLRSVWTVGTWNLNPGVFRLSKWVKDFNPNLQNQTHTQTWIRIYDLPLEYWRPRILFEIASAVGTPISLDQNTKLKTYGHYARVLVDVDLAGNFLNTLMVEREGFAFYVGIDYEALPAFCTCCKTIGHLHNQCKSKKQDEQHSTLKHTNQHKPTKDVSRSSKDKGNEGLVYVEPVTNHQAEPSGCKKDDVVEHHSRVPDSDPKEHEHEISYEQDFSKSIIEVDEGEGKNSEDTLVDDIQQHLSPNRGVLNTLKDTPNVIIIPTKASADLSENVQQDINIVKQLWGDEKEDGIEDNERGYTLVTHRKGRKPKLQVAKPVDHNTHDKDFVFIAEPKIQFEKIHPSFWNNLNLKSIGFNVSNKPSLWCLCSNNCSPTLVASTSQFCAFQVHIGSNVVYIAAVYASTSYIIRRNMWKDLNNLLLSNPGAWVILGVLPTLGPMADLARLIPRKGLIGP